MAASQDRVPVQSYFGFSAILLEGCDLCQLRLFFSFLSAHLVGMS